MSKILIAEFRLEDGLGNEEVLLVHRGNGQIFYTLSGKNGGVLHSLKNLQLWSLLLDGCTGSRAMQMS